MPSWPRSRMLLDRLQVLGAARIPHRAVGQQNADGPHQRRHALSARAVLGPVRASQDGAIDRLADLIGHCPEYGTVPGEEGNEVPHPHMIFDDDALAQHLTAQDVVEDFGEVDDRVAEDVIRVPGGGYCYSTAPARRSRAAGTPGRDAVHQPH